MKTSTNSFRLEFTTESKELEQELKTIAACYKNVWDRPDSLFSASIDLNYPTLYTLVFNRHGKNYAIVYMQYKKMLTAKGIEQVVYYGASFDRPPTEIFEKKKMMSSLLEFVFTAEQYPIDPSLNDIAKLCKFDLDRCLIEYDETEFVKEIFERQSQ